MTNWIFKMYFKEYYKLIATKIKKKKINCWVCCYQVTIKSSKDISRKLADFYACIFRMEYWATMVFDLENFVGILYSNTVTWGKSLLFWFKHPFMESYFSPLLLQSVDALGMLAFLDEVHFPKMNSNRNAFYLGLWWCRIDSIKVALLK